jgi:hypothetical protein
VLLHKNKFALLTHNQTNKNRNKQCKKRINSQSGENIFTEN